MSLLAIFKDLIWLAIVNSSHTSLYKNKSPMPSVSWCVSKSLLSPGVLAELEFEFPEVEMVGTHVLVKVFLEICVVVATYFHQPKPGTVGPTEWTLHGSIRHLLCTGRLGLAKADHIWRSLYKRKFLNFLLWLKIKLKTMKRLRKLSSFFRNVRPDVIKRSLPLSKWELAKAKQEVVIISSARDQHLLWWRQMWQTEHFETYS